MEECRGYGEGSIVPAGGQMWAFIVILLNTSLWHGGASLYYVLTGKHENCGALWPKEDM